MRITKINEWFTKIGVLQVKHRFLFVAGILILTAFCCAGLKSLKLGTNETEYFEDWEKIKIDTDRFKEIFGAADGIAVLFEADDVFDPEVLDAIGRMGKRLEMEVPFAKNVTSLMDLSVTQGTEDGFEVINPFEKGIPSNPEELEEKKQWLLQKESIVNNLVSDDAKSTWLILSLEDYGDSVDEVKEKIAVPAREIFESDEFKSEKYSFKQCGLTYTEYEEDQAISGEVVMRIAIGFLVMILFLVIFIHSLRGVLVPFFATFFAILSSLGVAGWTGVKMDTQLIMLPVLLSMALAVGYAVHYINSFRMFFRRTGSRKKAVELSVGESGWPILFTAITTMAGMVSFSFSGLVPLRRTGLLSAGAVFAVYAYIMTLLPALLSLGKDRSVQSEENKNGATKLDLAFERCGKSVINGKRKVLILSAVVIIGMIPGIFKSQVNMDMIDMMGTKVDYIRRLVEISENKLGSMYSYNVFIESGEEGFFKKSENMKKLDELQKKLGTLSMTKLSGTRFRVSSISETVKEMNRTLNSDDKAFYKIPDDDDLLSQELFLYEISGGDDLYNQITEDFSTTYMEVQMKNYDATKIAAEIAQAKRFAQEMFPDANCAIVGEVANFAEMNGKLVWAELKSFAVSFLLILILMILAFGSVKTGLIGMVPNVAPVILIGGVMGFLKIPLDMITMLVMPMILGIAVDDTIHFNNHVKFQFEKNGSYTSSILATFREIGKTMGMTTVILCSMFAVLAFSILPCFARIGYLSIIGLFGALVADYTLTPVLILVVKAFGGKKEENL
ncbi:efflux RND transporter permease subunit [Treponema sp.]|uniref:efflux RND transporter permease subunit n=1 Tax=Treponema sp. TaxID=166 RepID=UPI003890C591